MLYNEYANNDYEGGVKKVKHYLEQLADGFVWKVILSLIGLVICELEGFYTSLLWGFLGMFVLDFITGVLKSRKRGIAFSSRRLRDSVYKLAAYMVLLTAVICVGRSKGVPEASFSSLVPLLYYYYIFTEFKSILENVEALGVKVPGFISVRVDNSIENTTGESTPPKRARNKREAPPKPKDSE